MSARNCIGSALLAAIVGGCADAPADPDPPTTTDDGASTGDASADAASSSTSEGVDEGSSTTDDAPPPPDEQSSLPLEVLGRPEVEPVEVALVIDVPSQTVEAGPLRLELRLHNIVASGATELELGPDRWDLGDPGLPFLRPQGGVSSGAIALPPGSIVAGANTLVFRYTAQVPDVSGYRVLSAAVVGDRAHHEARLPVEDPSDWSGPSEDPDALERGRAYFTEISRDGGPVCAACHTDSGADLQYFAFSNRSIVTRAMLHEFSHSEAEEIASYIRSLPVAPAGRIYDPVFQPGLGAVGAAGAGIDAVLGDDAAFAASTFDDRALDEPLAWDWPAQVDTFRLPTDVQLPGWFRWMPRSIDPTWFERNDGALEQALSTFRADPTEANAVALQAVAVELGLQLLFEDDARGRVDLLRLVAVKLWDWSRQRGFEAADHGIPDWGLPYPYEVGFAFFEAADGGALPYAWDQTYEWWWAQLAVNPGRGLANGQRPIDYADLLRAADSAGAGPAALAFLHLVGSWEESRGALAVEFGTELGPVRLLPIPMSRVDDPAVRLALLHRFIARVAEHVDAGGTLSDGFLTTFTDAWTIGCVQLDADQQQALRDLAPAPLLPTLEACP